jgi:hypothetical protein
VSLDQRSRQHRIRYNPVEICHELGLVHDREFREGSTSCDQVADCFPVIWRVRSRTPQQHLQLFFLMREQLIARPSAVPNKLVGNTTSDRQINCRNT